MSKPRLYVILYSTHSLHQVLEQQRQEQARFTAAQQRPEQPVDPAEFVRNLNPTLRRQVLADMDDTVLAVLPPELSTEAQGLRRELEQRRANQMERAMTRSDFSQFLRHTGISRAGASGPGFQSIARLFPRGQMNSWKVTDGPPGSQGFFTSLFLIHLLMLRKPLSEMPLASFHDTIFYRTILSCPF